VNAAPASAVPAAMVKGTDDMTWLTATEQRLRLLEHRLGRRNLETMLLGVAILGVAGSLVLGFAMGRRRGRRRKKTGAS